MFSINLKSRFWNFFNFSGCHFLPENPSKSRDLRWKLKGVKRAEKEEKFRLPPQTSVFRSFSLSCGSGGKNLPKKLGKQQVTKSSVAGKSLRRSRALPKESVSFQLLSPWTSWSFAVWKCHRSCPGSIFRERSPWCSIKKCLLPFIPEKKSGNLESSQLEEETVGVL